MSEIRFQRIEDKVDEIKSDIVEIKVKMDIHMDKIEEHITGDKKIISEISPLLQKLPGLIEIIEDHAFTKRKLKESKEKAKEFRFKLGVVTACIAIVVGAARIISVI